MRERERQPGQWLPAPAHRRPGRMRAVHHMQPHPDELGQPRRQRIHAGQARLPRGPGEHVGLRPCLQHLSCAVPQLDRLGRPRPAAPHHIIELDDQRGPAMGRDGAHERHVLDRRKSLIGARLLVLAAKPELHPRIDLAGAPARSARPPHRASAARRVARGSGSPRWPARLRSTSPSPRSAPRPRGGARHRPPALATLAMDTCCRSRRAGRRSPARGRAVAPVPPAFRRARRG